MLIGAELVVARRKQVKVYRLADALCDMGCGVAQQTGVLLYSGILLAAYAWLYEHARLVTLPTWALVALAVVLVR